MTKNILKGPRSPTRVMHLLEELASNSDGLTLAKLSARLDTPKTSLLSLLRSLEAEDYIEVQNKTYQLGAKAFRLGNLISSKMKAWSSFPSAIRPFLVELSKESGETILSGVMAEEGTHGVFIDIVEGSGAIHLSSVIGSHRPLYCSAFGKTLLAFQTVNFIEAYLNTADLVSPTTGKKFSKDALLKDLSEIRKTGICISIEEMVEGAGGFGVPIFGASGQLLGAVALAAPVNRAIRRRDEYAELMHKAGERASQLMGYTKLYPGSVEERH